MSKPKGEMTMNIKLSDNIRMFRKAQSLTQEQLAEALGVTVGAVYKWEAKLSTPDINLIIELADLFDTSVDVLLGYELKSNKQNATMIRLKELLHDRDKRGLAEADKALMRYPNCFDIVYQCAKLYGAFGLMWSDKELLQRCIELMERAVLLIGQNTDTQISELSIHNEIAEAYFSMGEAEKAIELLKSNNPCGINDALIGQAFASECNMPDEAIPYLSMALLNNIASFTRVVMGYCNVYFKKKEFAAAVDILQAALNFFEHLRKQDENSFLDKVSVCFYVCLAMAQIELDNMDTARKLLRIAKSMAEEFDHAPDYGAGNIRFVSMKLQATAFDDLGATAMDHILNSIKEFDSQTLSALWEEINHAG